MLIEPARVRSAIEGAVVFADGAWRRIDARGAVQEAAVMLDVSQAQHQLWDEGHQGNTLSMAGSFSMPETAFAPQPALVIRRVDLQREETTARLVAELRRVFADGQALAGP